MLAGLNSELEASKAKLAAIEAGLKAANDRAEVERCVGEMVAWVSEQLTGQ